MESTSAEGDASSPRRATSRLAVASALMGGVSVPLVCCSLGVSGALAVMLGMMALGRISASNGQLGGRAYAWAGIATGTVTVVLSLVLLNLVGGLQKDWDAQLDAGVRQTFEAQDGESARQALLAWSASSRERVSSGEIGAFANEARARFGVYRSMGLVSRSASPSLLGDQMVTHVVTFEFDGGTRSGVVVSRLRTRADAMTPTLYLASIAVNDDEARGGPLRFPPQAIAEGETTEPGAGSEGGRP
jgi:hypothetical protein